MDLSSLRIAIRTLGRHRGFTAVAVLSLGLVVALNTTMYSAITAMLTPAIPAFKPDHVFGIRYYGDTRKQLHPSAIEEAIQAVAPTYESVSGIIDLEFESRGLAEYGDRTRRVIWGIVRPNFFEFLGAPAVMGRTFTPQDEGTGAIVISDRLATILFDEANPVGRTINLAGSGRTIIGVVRRSSSLHPLRHDVWMLRKAGMAPIPITMVRFREKISRYGVHARLLLAANRLAIAAGEPVGSTAFRGVGSVVRPFRVLRFHRTIIFAAAAVLLVACANLANLQLARGLVRMRELAVRSALGASRGRLFGSLLLESAVLAVAGLIVSAILTLWGIQVLKSWMPPVMENYLIAPRPSWEMFGFAAGVALLCLFLVGLVPAWRASRVDPDTLLKSGAGTGANRQHRKSYGVLVFAQIGLALPVLVAGVVLLKASLLYDSRDYLVNERLGYDATSMVSATVPVLPAPGASAIAVGDLAARVIAAARSAPGVLDAAVMARRAPDSRWPPAILVDDADGTVRTEAAYQWAYRMVSPNYLRIFGYEMEAGRHFGDTEFDGSAVILDAPTARKIWGSRPAVGRAIKLGDARSSQPFHTVVGVLRDKRDTFAIRRIDPQANFYLKDVYRVIRPTDSVRVDNSNSAMRASLGEPPPPVEITVEARVRGDPELAALHLQRALRSVSGGLDPRVTPTLAVVGVASARQRAGFMAGLFATFAAVGVGLLAIGVFGIVSHSIEERRRELAVRMSLGASSNDILHAVLREGTVVILCGVAIGLLLTKYTVAWLASLVPEYFIYDVVLFAALALAVVVGAWLVALMPGVRATRIDPNIALRHE